jgi:hypothetical protein
MSLSWFFGSKKKTPGTEPQDYSAKSEGDFILVEKTDNLQLPSDSGCAGSCHYPALPYSLAPDSIIVPQTSPTKGTMNISHDQNFLDGVPFKLHPDTASVINDSVNRNRSHASEVLLHISQLNLKSFEYDFLVEKSVVLEAGDRDLG